MQRVVCTLFVILLVSAPALAVNFCPPPQDIKMANDPTYGYTKKNPIVVGHIGPKNVEAFMDLLRGPDGEKVTFKRAGSCCSFKTNQALVGDMASLEKYRVSYKRGKKSVILFFNQYDCDIAKIPDGFTTE